MSPNPRRWFVKLGRILCLLGFLAAVPLVLARTLLCVDSGFQPADVIIVAGGGSFNRVPRAAGLFQAGAAPGIILTGRMDGRDNRSELIAAGVPAAAIELEERSASTRDNAVFTRPLLQARRVKRAIIVTSWYHSRRALCTFQSVAPDVEFVSLPTYSVPTNFLHQQEPFHELLGIYREYPKLAWYWVRWGIPPVVRGK